MSERYRPSNGTEGDIFKADFCQRCQRDADADAPCEILTNSMVFDINDAAYPSEWIKDERGPRCTAFIVEGSELGSFVYDHRQQDFLA